MECRNITVSFISFNKFYIRVTELFQMNESATWQSLAYSQSIRLVWYEFKCILNISNIFNCRPDNLHNLSFNFITARNEVAAR